MPPKNEKRKIARMSFSQSVQLDLIQEESNPIKNEQITAQGMDISSRGLGLVTLFPLKRGQVLRVFIPAKGTTVFLPVFSEVRWVRVAKDEYRSGVQFLG
jgi:hypothetical protein